MGFLQFGLLFAAAGGVLGAVWASLQERGRPVQAVLEAFISAIAAAAAAERFVPLDQAWTCAAAGVFAGMMTGHALDTVRARAQGVARLSGRLGGKAYGCERRRVFGWKRLISSGIAAREDAVFRARPADARHYAAGLKTAKRREGRNPCGVSEFNLIRGKEKSV